ncbi:MULTISPECIES: DNA polymerase III subunit delta [unclassified Amycolatopsis]|uniref:DNA polymerase III subunit delta n=1 Tax=unclassified Amycolatopsis TaxID=2618356 RepID=UPI001FF10B88|nr:MULTISPECIES: DNA polymerase III subunit delta [unclassified Amycolatopsis]UOZ06501.1 DNA polymerase III subunit delta [Amycolatopsis sp. WQ 127309]WSJ72796.1 DNA polymerase III subunit delta [Amycolatopsis sp. NBC_01307]WSK83481.1 DNA polymerase III subunit delta [Amycolatopsis sp. NBC_01286]
MTAQATAPAPLHLVLGEEELLIERAVRETLAASRAIDATAELTRARVSDLTAPELAELVSPSLFSEGRVIVLESAQDISQELADAVTSYLKDPAAGIVLVVVHTGGGRSKAGKTLPAVLKKAGAEVTECPKLTKPAEREQFVRHEVRRAGGKIDPAGVAALIDAVGSDLRELSSAAMQLVADAGGVVDADAVHRYHRGRADVTGFAVAEKAVSGDRAAALESLRWAMQLGVPYVLVADALADAVRTIARVSGAGRGNPNQLAGELGMPPWKVRKAQGQSRGWNQDGLATAMRVVARLNAEVKGVAADPGYALERAVLQVAAAKGDR